MCAKVILPACSRAAGREITHFTSILDLSGIGMTDMMSKNIYNMSTIASKMAQDYYPEFVHKSFVINAPMLFSGFFNLVKPLLNSRTQAVLVVSGSKYQKELLAEIDENVLPVAYGGKNQAPLDGKDKGFYVQEVQMCMQLKKWEITPEDYHPHPFGGPGMPQMPHFPGQPHPHDPHGHGWIAPKFNPEYPEMPPPP
jgi:hypothetical protein